MGSIRAREDDRRKRRDARKRPLALASVRGFSGEGVAGGSPAQLEGPSRSQRRSGHFELQLGGS